MHASPPQVAEVDLRNVLVEAISGLWVFSKYLGHLVQGLLLAGTGHPKLKNFRSNSQ